MHSFQSMSEAAALTQNSTMALKAGLRAELLRDVSAVLYWNLPEAKQALKAKMFYFISISKRINSGQNFFVGAALAQKLQKTAQD